MFDGYLDRLERGLADQGFRGRLYIMSSSGGTLTTDTARRFPVRALESGPAAGALMSAYHGRRLDLPNLLSFDMGGTTAKGALVRGGTPIKRYSMEVARMHEFRQGSGLTHPHSRYRHDRDRRRRRQHRRASTTAACCAWARAAPAPIRDPPAMARAEPSRL